MCFSDHKNGLVAAARTFPVNAITINTAVMRFSDQKTSRFFFSSDPICFRRGVLTARRRVAERAALAERTNRFALQSACRRVFFLQFFRLCKHKISFLVKINVFFCLAATLR